MQAGDTIAGRFLLHKIAGRGGMGVVFQAKDQRTQALVAVKVVTLYQPSTMQRFQREAQLLSRLQHPGVVRYLEHGETPEGELYLVMEWLEGEDLSTRLKRGRLSLQEGLSLIQEVAESDYSRAEIGGGQGSAFARGSRFSNDFAHVGGAFSTDTLEQPAPVQEESLGVRARIMRP